jgi:DNA (cytosine-5)-methyltransferase 1
MLIGCPEPMRVVELFAGVGGFRLGLERAGNFDTIWFNQWEPATKVQHAYDCYVKQFCNGLVPTESNMDICAVSADTIPDHDLLVGGFPCQDYSVAATLDKSKGLQGKKGVLWWEIRRILEAKSPKYVLLENVDRLLRSPASQRGRDFAILLACMRDLGYNVEWRVVNAADYGFPQKRRRVFIMAAKQETALGKKMSGWIAQKRVLSKSGFFAPTFKTIQPAATAAGAEMIEFSGDVQSISDSFETHFQNAGIMVGTQIRTLKVQARKENQVNLENVLEKGVPENYIIPENLISGPRSWEYFRSSKSEERTAKNGHKYRYAEGKMAFPDPINQPARTIITGEGGVGPSRSKHAILDPETNKIRTLTPLECERLNTFPDNHTESIPERWRYFTMGNALVVDVVKMIGERFTELTAEPDQELSVSN